MPQKREYSYGGTITFDSSYTLEKKNILIDLFPDMLAKHLLYSKERAYYLKVGKEYHKVEGQDDYEAPHLHFILQTNTWLPKYRVRAIQKYFNDKYGRSQFFLMTTLKINSYSKYIQKDSERLLEKLGVPHYTEMNLEDSVRSYWDNQFYRCSLELEDMSDQEQDDYL